MKRLTYKILWYKVFGIGFAFARPVYIAALADEPDKYCIIPIHVHLGPLYVMIDIAWKR